MHRIILGVDQDEFENDQVFRRIRSPSLASDPSLEQLQAIIVFDPIYGQYALPEPSPQADRVETQESTGFSFKIRLRYQKSYTFVWGGFDDYDQRLVNRRSDTTRSSESRFSPQLGMVYRFADDASFYAAYGENFRPLSGTDSERMGSTLTSRPPSRQA